VPPLLLKRDHAYSPDVGVGPDFRRLSGSVETIRRPSDTGTGVGGRCALRIEYGPDQSADVGLSLEPRIGRQAGQPLGTRGVRPSARSRNDWAMTRADSIGNPLPFLALQSTNSGLTLMSIALAGTHPARRPTVRLGGRGSARIGEHDSAEIARLAGHAVAGVGGPLPGTREGAA